MIYNKTCPKSHGNAWPQYVIVCMSIVYYFIFLHFLVNEMFLSTKIRLDFNQSKTDTLIYIKI